MCQYYCKWVKVRTLCILCNYWCLFVPWNIIDFHLILSILGIVGEMDDKGESLYVWTHKKFEIGFNGKQVGDVQTRITLNRVKLTCHSVIFHILIFCRLLTWTWLPNLALNLNWMPNYLSPTKLFGKRLKRNLRIDSTNILIPTFSNIGFIGSASSTLSWCKSIVRL